jgi:hypothetical protein
MFTASARLNVADQPKVSLFCLYLLKLGGKGCVFWA